MDDLQSLPWPQPHLHYDVLALVFVLGLGYAYAERRLRHLVAPAAAPATTGQWVKWYTGLAFMFAVSSWPIHDVGETALFWVHMVEHMVIIFVTAPLLLLGTPRWMADATIGRPGVARVLRQIVHPVPAFTILTIVLIGIHWPVVVEWMLVSAVAHFAIHALLFTAALIAWMPVRSPTPALPRLEPPMAMFYLFLHSLLPTIPASFLTFSSVPIYPVYGDAALAWGVTPLTDQTMAGLIMKLGGGLLLWGAIAVIWFRWVAREREWDRIEADLRTSTRA
ncbi:hypothetical protein BH23ACT5_BH23ACT5_20420 [soil metagenome]